MSERPDGVLRAAVYTSVGFAAAMVLARLYDQNGHLVCVSETGDRSKGPYVLVELVFLLGLWLSTLLAAVKVALGGVHGRRTLLVALVAPHALLAALRFGNLGYCK